MTLKIKFHDFTIKNRSVTVDNDIVDFDNLQLYFYKLMSALDWEDKKIRLLGLSVSVPYKRSGLSLQLEIPDRKSVV